MSGIAAQQQFNSSSACSLDPTVTPSNDAPEKHEMLKDRLRHLRPQTPVISQRKNSNLMEDYFVGPARLDKFSKWPTFMRLYGSILPEMLIPLLFVAGWSTAVVCISVFVYSLAVNQVLLTVLGFVVALGLSFRSSTAYERYGEGRRYWAQLKLASINLARIIWIHAAERTKEPDMAKTDLLHKLTGLNLIVAFSVALKHRLRFEPYTLYEDLHGLVGHMDTFATEATSADHPPPLKKDGAIRKLGKYLGVSFAEENPMTLVKRTDKPLGNLPLEILSYLASYIDELVENAQLKTPAQLIIAYNAVGSMTEVQLGTERILHTPLPLAYRISISQITWVYIIMLPFQLVGTLKWITIPATIIAAYIILGILLIGAELENPFGYDVNDLPLDVFCEAIADDIEVLSSKKKPSISELVQNPRNRMFFPLNTEGYNVWANKSEDEIRKALGNRPEMNLRARKRERLHDHEDIDVLEDSKV